MWGMCRQIVSWSQVSPGPQHLQGTGIWAKLIPVSTAGLIFATDGSGGPLSKEPRLRQVGFGVVALALQLSTLTLLSAHL